jgi:hypothetical protein
LSHDQDFPNRYCVQNCLGCHTYDPRRNFELRKS